jgi:hydroxyacylglutathione hydrolase
MQAKITTIRLPLAMNLGQVNCYLIAAGAGFVLVDTGGSNSRAQVDAALGAAGCGPGRLRLIFLTHGDFDHTGNAAYLKRILEAPIAMHAGDVGMVERGDMSWGRERNKLMLRLSSRFLGFPKAARFTPDALLAGEADLSAFGLHASVVHLACHSRGSIGLLLDDGAFFCGDLLENTKAPAINSIMDDRKSALATLQMLKAYPIATVYPGHGQPFPFAALATGAQE